MEPMIRLTCHTCRIPFNDRDALFRHRCQIHGDRAYKCPLCAYVNSSRRAIVEEHVPERHKGARMGLADVPLLAPDRARVEKQVHRPDRRMRVGPADVPVPAPARTTPPQCTTREPLQTREEDDGPELGSPPRIELGSPLAIDLSSHQPD